MSSMPPKSPPPGSLDGKQEPRPFFPRVLALIGILAGWEVLGRFFEFRPEILPTPSRLIMEVLRSPSDFREHTLSTVSASLAGLLIAVAAALPFWLWTCLSKKPPPGISVGLARAKHVPLAVAVPIFAAWWGFGISTKMTTAALFAVWPVMGRLATGIQLLWPETATWLRLTGANPFRRVLKACLPAWCYFLGPGLGEACAMSLSGTLTAEFFGAETGLGYLLMLGTARADGALFAAALGLIFMVMALVLALVRLAAHLSRMQHLHE